MQPGLYEKLLTIALQTDLDQLADPRLYSLAEVDPEETHAALAQFLEHLLANCLARHRGKEATERQRRLVDRILATLADELGQDRAQQLNVSTPLRRLMAIHASPADAAQKRPDTPLARSALLTGTRLDPSLMQMLHITIWGDQSLGWSLKTAANRLGQNPSVVSDLREILQYQLQHAPALHAGQLPAQSGPLTIHAQYTRDEILVGLGHWSLNNRPRFTEGVLHVAPSKVDAFFVTLQKTEEDYSPTTMYEDYLVSHDCFHWQSQSSTSEQSPTGQRYLQHRRMGYTPLLFVRETKELPSGLAAPYYFLGPCEYQSHTGGRPISIIWKLKHRAPARLFRVMARQNAG